MTQPWGSSCLVTAEWMIARRKNTAVAVVIAVNREHDHGLRVLDFDVPRVSAMLPGLLSPATANALPADVSGFDPVAGWRFQLADNLARGLVLKFCKLLFHSPA
jgi:hypothetical protein